VLEGRVTVEMNKLSSVVERRGPVDFPAFTGERVYMREFLPREGLPDDLRRWQATVDAMLDGIDVAGPVFLMVDQARVQAGACHRRPGLHIDGYWCGSRHNHRPSGVAYHGPSPSPSPSPHSPSPSPSPRPHRSDGETWETAPYDDREAIILAADVLGCRAYVGDFARGPRSGGNCAHLSVAALDAIDMEPGRVYAGNVTMLHESLPVLNDVERTVVRLNVPGWSPS
jgi:hypothetical protein